MPVSHHGYLGTLWLCPAWPCCRKQDIRGIQGPVVKQSPWFWLGECCEGWPGTGSCWMAWAGLPYLPWVGALGAALALCSVLFVLRRWWLLIVPGDPALINVTPISLLPRLSLTLEQKQLCCFLQEHPLPYGKGVSAVPLPGSRAFCGAAHPHSSGAGSGGSACSLCLEGKAWRGCDQRLCLL